MIALLILSLLAAYCFWAAERSSHRLTKQQLVRAQSRAEVAVAAAAEVREEYYRFRAQSARRRGQDLPPFTPRLRGEL